MATFKWTDAALGSNPALNGPRSDRVNQYQISGHAHPQPMGATWEDGAADSINALRVKTHRSILPSHSTMGMKIGVNGTNTLTLYLAGNAISSFTDTLIGTRTGNQNIGGAASADGDIVSFDIDVNALSQVTSVHATLWYYQALLARFRAGHALKCLAFDVRGNCGASGTLTVVLYKTTSGGTKTAIKTITGTVNGDIALSDTAIGSGGELLSTDTLSVEIENIPPRLRHLAWNITVRPAYIAADSLYTIGASPYRVTVEKLDNSKQRVVTGIAPLEIFSGTSPTGVGNNILRMQSRRHLLATCLEMGIGAQSSGTVTFTLRPGGQTVSTTGTGIQTAETVLAQTYAGGTNVIGVDLTGVGTGHSRLSWGIMAIPYNEIAQFRAPFPGRILGFEVMGYTATATPTGTLDATLRNRTTSTDIKRLNTATASSSSFEERDDALAVNVAANDLLAVRLDAVPQGTTFIAWRLTYTPAVEGG